MQKLDAEVMVAEEKAVVKAEAVRVEVKEAAATEEVTVRRRRFLPFRLHRCRRIVRLL